MTTTPPTAIPTIGPVPSLDFEELELFASAPEVGEPVAVTYFVDVGWKTVMVEDEAVGVEVGDRVDEPLIESTIELCEIARGAVGVPMKRGSSSTSRGIDALTFLPIFCTARRTSGAVCTSKVSL